VERFENGSDLEALKMICKGFVVILSKQLIICLSNHQTHLPIVQRHKSDQMFSKLLKNVDPISGNPRASHSATCDVIAGKDCGMFVYFEICDFVLFF